MKPILIVDYGMANLRSVQKAFEKLGFAAEISGDNGLAGSFELRFDQAMVPPEAVGLVGHHEVGDDDIDRLPLEGIEGVLTVCRFEHFEALHAEADGQTATVIALVVNDENTLGHGVLGSSSEARMALGGSAFRLGS